MGVQSYNPDQDVLTITRAAQKHFLKQVEKAAAQALRIGIKKSGCTGYAYVLDTVTSGESGDLELRFEQGLKVYLDPAALSVLKGTEIDYGFEGINQVVKYNNPNARDYCGCGESFSVDEADDNVQK